MHPDQVWDVVNAQRRALVDLLPALSEEDWRRPSLCGGWTVRDVVAHLAIQNDGLSGVLPALLRAGGNIDRAVRDSACRAALRFPTSDLIARVAAVVDTRRQPPFVGFREVLIDWLVHPLDIMVPLGRAFPTPPTAAAFAASRVWTMGYPFHARKRFGGYAFAANDADWSAGSGALVRGPMESILLLLAGRSAALTRLEGPGAAVLRPSGENRRHAGDGC